MKTTLSLLAVLALTAGAQAQDLAEGQMWWGHYSNQQTALTGNYQLGTYEVAMFVDGSGDLKGVDIAGARMQTRLYSNAKDVTLWVRSSLDGANLYEQTIESPAASGWSSATFESPVSLPKAGLYVGYSFTLSTWYSDYDYTPVVYGKKVVANSFFLKQPGESAFTDKSATGCATTQLVISGDALKANALTISDNIDDVVALAGTPVEVNVTITNQGTAGVQSFDFTYSLDGASHEGHIDLSNPIGQMFGEQGSFTIALGAPQQLGQQEVELKITKVNGQANEVTGRKTKATVLVNVLSESAPRTALAEIYVGPGKYWSSRGLVGAEQLSAHLGEQVIPVVYQSYDSPWAYDESVAYQKFADGSLRFTSYPACEINREVRTDPYYGNATAAPYHFEADQVVEPTLSAITEGSIAATAHWADEELRDEVVINGTATFTGDFSDAAYRMAFIVIADGFKQDFTNYCCYYKANYPDDDMAFWREGTYNMTEVPVNNMAVASTDLAGISRSIPATIEAGTDYELEVSLPLHEIEGQEPVNFRVVALLLNNYTKTVVNAALVPVSTTTAVKGIESLESNSVLFNFNGQRVDAPARGLYIQGGKKVFLF